MLLFLLYRPIAGSVISPAALLSATTGLILRDKNYENDGQCSK